MLDTWFSSALWPFATLGWPDETVDLEAFYPNNMNSTAREIINLWVSRMIMTGLEFMGEVPFHDVAIHCQVQATDGRRMSKSLGTGVDPRDLIEKYGTDAVRAWAASVAMSSQDVRFDESRVEGYRRFCNKLWNATRLVLSSPGSESADKPGTLEMHEHLEDRWVLSRLSYTWLRSPMHRDLIPDRSSPLRLWLEQFCTGPGSGHDGCAPRRGGAGRRVTPSTTCSVCCIHACLLCRGLWPVPVRTDYSCARVAWSPGSRPSARTVRPGDDHLREIRGHAGGGAPPRVGRLQLDEPIDRSVAVLHRGAPAWSTGHRAREGHAAAAVRSRPLPAGAGYSRPAELSGDRGPRKTDAKLANPVPGETPPRSSGAGDRARASQPQSPPRVDALCRSLCWATVLRLIAAGVITGPA